MHPVLRQMMANQLTEPSQTYGSSLMTMTEIVPLSPVFACARTALFALMALANVAFGTPPMLISYVIDEPASTFAATVPYLYRDTENYSWNFWAIKDISSSDSTVTLESLYLTDNPLGIFELLNCPLPDLQITRLTTSPFVFDAVTRA